MPWPLVSVTWPFSKEIWKLNVWHDKKATLFHETLMARQRWTLTKSTVFQSKNFTTFQNTCTSNLACKGQVSIIFLSWRMQRPGGLCRGMKYSPGDFLYFARASRRTICQTLPDKLFFSKNTTKKSVNFRRSGTLRSTKQSQHCRLRNRRSSWCILWYPLIAWRKVHL